MFIASDEEQNTANVWLTINDLSESQQKDLIEAFRSIERLEELLFVDWGWGSLFFLRDEASSQHYLQERTERIKAFQKKWLEERSSNNEMPKAPWWRFWG